MLLLLGACLQVNATSELSQGNQGVPPAALPALPTLWHLVKRLL